MLGDKSFNIAKNKKYDKYQHELASVVCRFFDKKSITHTEKEINSESQQLAKLQNFKKVRLTLLLKTAFRCTFYCVLLILLVDMHGCSFKRQKKKKKKKKKVLQLLMLLKKF